MGASTQSSMRRETRMATRVSPYLRFNGNCREAMQFYKECIGGELTLMTVAESPEKSHMPTENPNHVFHSSLTSGSIELLGSDMAPKGGLLKGNTMALALECASEQEMWRFFAKLSAGGRVGFSVAPASWGGLYGQLVDRFGNEWMLTYMEETRS